MTTCPNCETGGGACCRPPLPPDAMEIARAETIIRQAGGYVFWPQTTPVGDECTCGQGGALGEHHAQTCPFYTPY